MLEFEMDENERPARKMVRKNVQMPIEMWEALDEFAADNFTNVQEVIRGLVKERLIEGGYIQIKTKGKGK